MKAFTAKLVLVYFLTAAAVVTFSQQNRNGLKITFNCNDMPLRSMLKALEERSGLNFIFSDNLLSKDAKIKCSLKETPIKYALNKIFNGTDISFKLFDDNSVVLFKSKSLSRTEYNAKIIEEKIPVSDTVHFYSEAKMLPAIEPGYPTDAVINKMEGKVTVKLFINSNGDVAKAQIEHSSKSPVLDSASLKYAYDQKFIPAKVDGKPINSWYIITFLYSVIDGK